MQPPNDDTREFGTTNLNAGFLLVSSVGSYLFGPHYRVRVRETRPGWAEILKTKSLNDILGKTVRKARIALGLTQEDAAEKIGISVEFYARIERGQALPSLKTFFVMAIVFQGADKLLGFTDNETAQRILKEWADKQPKDPPELRRLFRRLRREGLEKVPFVMSMLTELDNFIKAYMGEDDDEDEDVDISPAEIERMPTSDDLDIELGEDELEDEPEDD